jgi:cell division protease FtsH
MAITNKKKKPSEPRQQVQPSKPPMGKSAPGNIWWWVLLIVVLNFVLTRYVFQPEESSVTISYSAFRQQVEAGNVKAVKTKGDEISGTFVKEIQYYAPVSEEKTKNEPQKVHTFVSIVPSFVDKELETLLSSHQVQILATSDKEKSSPFWSFVSLLAPALLFIAFYLWIFRRMQSSGGGGPGGFMGFGKSTAKRFDKNEGNKVTFEDVAGIDEAENELVEIVDFLKNPEKYTKLGAYAPKGVLLIGAPGTGKTLLARAIAGEAAVPFFSMSASEFVEMIVGVGAARVRDLFTQARAAAPAIIFIDELDSIGRARGQFAFGGASEQEQTLNQILTEMDGFSSKEGIIVLAATNQPDVLDKALLRPGRFDRRVVINLPDKAGREAILKVHTRQVPLDVGTNLGEISAMTPGFSGADIKNLVNEAALNAAKKARPHVTLPDFTDALEKIVLGPERPLLLSQDDRRRIAYHESGHAILGLVVPGADPVHRVSIVPRGMSLGVTYQRPDTDRYNYSETYLQGRIIGILGGRAAEELVYGDKTTGAENDIQQATAIARNMVGRWGMSPRLGMQELSPRQNPFLQREADPFINQKPFSEKTAQTIDEEVQRIITESYEKAITLLKQYRIPLDEMAESLLKNETLDEKDIERWKPE